MVKHNVLVVYKSDLTEVRLNDDWYDNAKYEMLPNGVLNFSGDRIITKCFMCDETDLNYLNKVEDKYVLTRIKKRLFRKPITIKYIPCFGVHRLKGREHVNITTTSWTIIEH